MKFIPHNDVIIGRLLNESKKKVTEGLFTYEQEDIPIYEVVSIGELKDIKDIKIGDHIVTNSIPTRIDVKGFDEDHLYIIREEYIAAKTA